MRRQAKLVWIAVGACLLGATPPQPSSGTRQQPVSGTGQKPATGTDQQSSTGTGQQRPSTGTGQQPSTGTGQQSSEPWRDYGHKLTPAERQTISYIIITVGETPTYKLMFQAGSLDAAGKDVKHVHPLRFLEAIFANPKAHAALVNLWKENSFAKDQVFGGIQGSLRDEMARGNLTDAQIRDFARTVGIKDPTPLITAAHGGQWDQFMNYVIQNVPRQGAHNAYDM